MTKKSETKAQVPKKPRGRPRKHPVSKDNHPLKKDAPQANYFVLCNGQPVKNVKELADIMDGLEDHVFSHHVRPEHNDFAAWVKDIIKDVELAEKLAQAKDKQHFQLVLYKHITHKLW
ncbi:hypothetical protein JW711_05385 [Candidatus Woesearchaeota archaeon]|nr:hypothetical protein [Candidatus Woesearchaeota archaeon]